MMATGNRTALLRLLVFMILGTSCLWASDVIEQFKGTGTSGLFHYSIYNNRWLGRRGGDAVVIPRVVPEARGDLRLKRVEGDATPVTPVSPEARDARGGKRGGGDLIAITAVSPEAEAELIIPSVLDGYTVYSISGKALADCQNVTSITIPATLSKLEPEAFNRCPGLKTIHVGKNHPRFASVNGVLYDRRRKTLLAVGGGRGGDYTVPESTIALGSFAFAHCTGLKSVILPEGVVDVGGRQGRTFAGCTGLERITLPDTVTNIGQMSFKGCASLKEVTIPPKVTEVPFGLFWQCTGLTRVTLPDGITGIGNYAFAECARMKMEGLPKSLTTIGAYAFKGCQALNGLIVPGSVTKMGRGALMGSGITPPKTGAR